MKTTKIFFNVLLVVCTVVSFFSCKEDEHSPVLTKIEASTLDAIGNGSDFVLVEPAKGTNPVLFTTTWTETYFYLDGSNSPMPAGPVTYNLQMDKAGNNFKDPVVIAAAQEPYADVYVKDMNAILLKNFAIPSGEATDMEIRLIIYYGLDNTDNSVVSKNTLYTTLTPYEPSKEGLSNIYMIGNMNGWNNENTDFIMYRDDSDPGNLVYTYTGFFKNQDDGSDCFFKFASEENLGDWNKMYINGGNGVLKLGGDADGAAFQVSEGYYTVTLNISEMSYTINAYDASSAVSYDVMCAVGAFCNWGDGGTDPELTKSVYDGHQWALDLTFDSQTSCKFRANHDWTANWGGKEDAFPYGRAIYNDQGSTTVPAGTFRVYFNDLTGHYVFIEK